MLWRLKSFFFFWNSSLLYSDSLSLLLQSVCRQAEKFGLLKIWIVPLLNLTATLLPPRLIATLVG